MNKETIKEIIYIVISIILSIIAVKFVIWLLPFIIIALLSYIIYINIKKSKKKNTNKEKDIKIIHDFDDEKKIKKGNDKYE